MDLRGLGGCKRPPLGNENSSDSNAITIPWMKHTSEILMDIFGTNLIVEVVLM